LCLLALAMAVLCGGKAGAQSPEADGSSLRVALITAAPGAIYWERFGHNAILIEDSISGDRRLYNFGWFDFGQENFMLNFARGRMLYLLAATDPDRDIAGYRAEGRSVWMQELDLDAAQKLALARKLALNALPENAEYRYDYYVDNCSTRVRDALDEVLGGAIKRQSLGRGRGETYRSLSLAYARPITWLTLGIDLGLGPAADRPINFWEEAFLPLRLRDLANEIQIEDGAGALRPLVRQQRTLFAGPLDDNVPRTPDWFLHSLLIGFALATALRWALRSERAALRTAAAGIAAVGSSVIGVVGLGLLGLWFGTDHEIAWRNANIALFSPLSLLLVPALWRLRHPLPNIGTLPPIVALIVLAGIGMCLVAALLKFNTQSQLTWFPLLSLWHAVMWWALAKAKA
jgi:hypothetical protein